MPRVRKFHIDKCHDQEKTRGENVFPQSTLDSRSQSFKIPSLQRRKLDVPLLQACHVLLFISKIHQGLSLLKASLYFGKGCKSSPGSRREMPGHFERVPFAKLSNKGQVSQLNLILKLYSLKFELLVCQHHPCPTNAKEFNVLRGLALKPFFGKANGTQHACDLYFPLASWEGDHTKVFLQFWELSWTTMTCPRKANFGCFTFMRAKGCSKLSKITTLNPPASCEQLDVFHLRYPSIHSHSATAMLLRESSGSSWEGMFNEAGDKIAESIGYVHHRRQHANLTFLQGKCPAQHRDIHVQPSFDTMSKK